MSLCLEICNIYIKLVMRLPINKTKGYFQTIFFVKSSKFLPKYHLNLFPKSQFSSYINPCLVILFWEVQNQNKQKGTSRYLYQNNNKRPRFLTQKSDSWQKQFWKYLIFREKQSKLATLLFTESRITSLIYIFLKQ